MQVLIIEDNDGLILVCYDNDDEIIHHFGRDPAGLFLFMGLCIGAWSPKY